MEKKKSKTVRNTIIIMLFMAVGIIGIFWWIINQDKTADGTINSNATEAETLLQRDMVNNYPKTPRELLKLYSRFTKCMYNDEMNDETLKALLEKKRKLFDQELLEKNPIEVQMENLKIDIESYRNDKRVIANYIVDKSSDIEIKKVDDVEAAKASVAFFVKNTNGYEEVYEEFTLRVDKEGNWKILGWIEKRNQEVEEKQ